jgi:hypothetical protein
LMDDCVFEAAGERMEASPALIRRHEAATLAPWSSTSPKSTSSKAG